MKISKKEQDKVRANITKAFVELVGEKGFRKTTLGAVAKQAGIGGSTIYNYFKSKEQILFAQSETMMLEAIGIFNKVKDLESYNLQERLQLYFDMVLERYEKDRAFVIEANEQISLTPFSFVAEIHELKAVFGKPINEALNAAIASGEIASPPMQAFIESLIADYFYMLVYYWSNDKSKNQTQSVQLSDLSLNFGVSLLKSGALNKGMDLLQFLLKRHMAGFAGLVSQLGPKSCGCTCDCHKEKHEG
ncbi:MAG: TetR/AcrR family transcriptional regulator [SAR324 cluster bacterium]|nr:TetR/AcrR family transcriptional regulator [SAR324 cluster bacterium]